MQAWLPELKGKSSAQLLIQLVGWWSLSNVRIGEAAAAFSKLSKCVFCIAPDPRKAQLLACKACTLSVLM